MKIRGINFLSSNVCIGHKRLRHRVQGVVSPNAIIPKLDSLIVIQKRHHKCHSSFSVKKSFYASWPRSMERTKNFHSFQEFLRLFFVALISAINFVRSCFSINL